MEQGVKSDIAIVKEHFEMGGIDANTYSPLALAYIGDTVYDMVFKTIVVGKVNMAAHKYHKRVCSYVSAVAQSEMIEYIKDILTEKELDIYKRGRNSKPYNKAKNASTIEYQRATGLEALVGYLYLSDNMERICELIKYGLSQMEKKEA